MGGADGAATTPTALPSYFGATRIVGLRARRRRAEVRRDGLCDPSGKVAKSTWKRLGNLTGRHPSRPRCPPYPYTATTGLTSDGKPLAEFKKPLSYETNAQAIWQNTFLYRATPCRPSG